jgi:hypothetical protein
MSTITTRAGKGSQLTWTEVDSNFTNLNTDKIESSNAGSTGQVLTRTSGGAEWATPSSGGNNIIIISTGATSLTMPSGSTSNTTSTFTVESNGGISGISATTGTFTLPAGTYIMDFPFSTAATTDQFADLYLRDTTNNNNRVTIAGENITIVSTSHRRFSGRYTFTLPGTAVMTFRNESNPSAWTLHCGPKPAPGGAGLRFALIFYKIA